jgi:DNA-binding transcriptional LysR family regulator
MAWYTDDLDAAKREAAKLGVGVAALPKTTWQQWYAVLEGGPCGSCPEKLTDATHCVHDSYCAVWQHWN